MLTLVKSGLMILHTFFYAFYAIAVLVSNKTVKVLDTLILFQHNTCCHHSLHPVKQESKGRTVLGMECKLNFTLAFADTQTCYREGYGSLWRKGHNTSGSTAL